MYKILGVGRSYAPSDSAYSHTPWVRMAQFKQFKFFTEMKEDLEKELDLLKAEATPTPEQTKRIKEIEKELKKLADEEAAEKAKVVIDQSKLPVLDTYAMFLSAETREGKTGTAVIVNFMDVEGEMLELVTSEGYWDRLKAVATEEKPFAKIKAYKQKAGQRIRIADGSVLDVTRDSLNLQGIVRIPEAVWNKVVLGEQKTAKQKEEWLQKDIETISSLDKTVVDTAAIAQLMRANRYGV